MPPASALPGWAVFPLLWGISWAILIFVYILLDSTTSVSVPLVLGIAIAGIAAGCIAAYARLHFAPGGSAFQNALYSRGSLTGDPEDVRRASDPEERQAWKRLRHHQITRIEYERIMATRRYFHGEMTWEGYNQRVRELAEDERPREHRGRS